MRPLLARYLNLALTAAAIVVGFLSRSYVGTVRYLLLAAVAFLIALVLVFNQKYWVCPHCNKPIGKIGLFETTCPHCGKDLR